jgi:penicillin amidase
MRRKVLWFFGGLITALVVSVGAGLVYGWVQLRASLPMMDGSAALEGLSAPVTVERDNFGIPTVTAATRFDAARALGFLHAQDRFFQMDLLRRQAAGELAALVGVRALEADRAVRVHRFRHIARRAYEHASPKYRAVLDAYAAGVNAGLQALGARPFEYLVLRVEPQPWLAEDTFLTILAMFNTLQGRQASFEATLGTMAEYMPPRMFEFLRAGASDWDAPVMGDPIPRPAVPGPDVFDLRHIAEAGRRRQLPPPRADARQPACEFVNGLACLTDEEAAGLGSNNWAVDAAHSANGAALVANDMHLAINLPNIWYRASIVLPDPRAAGETLRMTGVTLPGVPGVVVGSNGHVAWGFTNSGGDWSDLVIVERDARDPDQYLTPDGPRPFERFTETIEVRGGAHERLEGEATIWGPVVRTDARGPKLAQRWVAHDAERLASDITVLEDARTLDELLQRAAQLGIPAQNFVAADSSGRIGWTIAGPIPRRIGFDGSRPTSWADGSRRWDGYLASTEHPRIIDPPAGRLWTANAPVVTGEMLTRIGEGGYAEPIRARIIRDRLIQLEKATVDDMLSVQLDTSALFHERWRRLVLETLTPEVVANDAARAEFRRLVETTWSGQADPSSVGYLLVRAFRAVLEREVFSALSEPILQHDPEFDFSRLRRSEGLLWQLVTERPRHLLNPIYASWDAQLASAIDLAIEQLTADGQSLAARSWGTFNRALIAHPLGNALPLFRSYLNLPPQPLPGDVYTPRAHSPRAGPSQRMIVSPGREHEGVMHMPGGQSGHPLSPHYADQHRAWVEGEALPFLPGAADHRLMLVPAR